MFNRIVLFMLVSFWLVMTYLLWRSEYVGEARVASNVPAIVVWKKVLTAPDTSSLEIFHEGVKVGYCRWAANLGLDPGATKPLSDDSPPMATQNAVTSYRLDLEGNVSLPETTGKMRFDCSINLSTNNTWDNLHLKLNLRPSVWEVSANSVQQTVRFMMDDQDGRFERVLKFSELQNPQTLMEDFNLPPAMGVLGALGTIQGAKGLGIDSLGLEWKGRSEWVSIGHTSVRAYILEAAVFERYRIRVVVSRVGEILKVELPDDWSLVNEQLGNL